MTSVHLWGGGGEGGSQRIITGVGTSKSENEMSGLGSQHIIIGGGTSKGENAWFRQSTHYYTCRCWNCKKAKIIGFFISVIMKSQ